jgi:hypothetical protein
MRKHFLHLLMVAALINLVSCTNSGDSQKKKEKEYIDKAMEQEYYMTFDPTENRIPYERLDQVRAYMSSFQTNGVYRTSSIAWTERGPNQVGGRTRAVFIDKRDATGNTIFAGGVGGGIWKCTNFKSTPVWAPLNDFMANIAISALIQDPVTPNTMYAGTGEGWFGFGMIQGKGIYKSTDGGNTWNQIPSTATFEFVQDLIIDNNGRLYATLRNASSTFRGLQRSTDGGTTWTQVLGAPIDNFATGRAADLELASNGDLYVTFGIQSTTGAIFKSSAAANGTNTGGLGAWTNITPTGTWQRIDVAIAPNNANVVYALMQGSSSSIGGIRRSDDGGTTWNTLSLPSWCDQGSTSSDFTRGQAWFDLIISVDPNNSNTVIIGGVDMLRSTDGGATFQQISQWASGCSGLPNVHADIHNVVYYPGSSTEIISANDGGIYYSNSGGTSWSNKNSGYRVTQFYACAVHPTNANFFLAGAQDNGTQRFTNAGLNNTTSARGGDGAFCHIDATDGQIQTVQTTGNSISYSRNGGSSFSSVPGSSSTSGRFINPSDYDDVLDVLYSASGANAYGLVTNLSGTTNPAFQTVSLSTTVLSNKQISALKVDPNATSGGVVWVASNSGSAAPSMTKLSSAHTGLPNVEVNTAIFALPNGAYISSIDVENGNANHILITVSNYGVVSVWESTDGGNTFNPIEGNLPDMPIRWGIFLPNTVALTGTNVGGGIMVATELGVWATSQVNGGSTNWVPVNTGLANVSSHMLQYRASDRLVAVATHGRGLFTTNLPSITTSVNTVLNTKGFINYVSADRNNVLIKTGNLTGIKQITVQVFDINGRLVKQQTNGYSTFTLGIGDLSSGTYVVKIRGDKKEQYTSQIVK